VQDVSECPLDRVVKDFSDGSCCVFNSRPGKQQPVAVLLTSLPVQVMRRIRGGMVIQHELDEASVLQEMTMTHAVNWFVLGKIEWLTSNARRFSFISENFRFL